MSVVSCYLLSIVKRGTMRVIEPMLSEFTSAWMRTVHFSTAMGGQALGVYWLNIGVWWVFVLFCLFWFFHIIYLFFLCNCSGCGIWIYDVIDDLREWGNLIMFFSWSLRAVFLSFKCKVWSSHCEHEFLSSPAFGAYGPIQEANSSCQVVAQVYHVVLCYLCIKH